FLTHNMARPPKDCLATGFRVKPREKICGAILSVRTFASALAPPWGSSDFFCHIIWRQREGSTKRAKRGKQVTPRYVAEPFASLRCIDKGFREIYATLSGGNPPRYETNYRYTRVLMEASPEFPIHFLKIYRKGKTDAIHYQYRTH